MDQKVIAASSYETVSMQKGELDEQVKELFFVSTRASNSAKDKANWRWSFLVRTASCYSYVSL
jgi:hypothetical protein